MVEISSRFAGPSLLRMPDGRFEAVLREYTRFEEQFQEMLLAETAPQPVKWRKE